MLLHQSRPPIQVHKHKKWFSNLFQFFTKQEILISNYAPTFTGLNSIEYDSTKSPNSAQMLFSQSSVSPYKYVLSTSLYAVIILCKAYNKSFRVTYFFRYFATSTVDAGHEEFCTMYLRVLHNQPTSRSRVIFEDDSYPAGQKSICLLRNKKVHYHGQNIPNVESILNQLSVVHIR